MGIIVADNFDHKSKKPLDARTSYPTLASMKAVADANINEGCLAYCAETDRYYKFLSTNTVDDITGKWRPFSGGGGGGHTIVDGSGTTFPSRSNLVFEKALVKDDEENDATIVSAESGIDVYLADVSGASGVQNFDTVTLKWTDPADKTMSGTIIVAEWAGTEVIRKAGSAPQSPDDGVLVVDSTTRNQYSSTGYVDEELDFDVTYYYRFFPYKMIGATKVYTDGTAVNVYTYKTVINNTPSTSSELVYTGSAQSPVWTNYNSNQLEIGGDENGINVDTYTTTFTPKTGYMWSDESTTARSISWDISKADITITLSKQSVVFDLYGSVTTDTVTATADWGTITISNSDNTVCTASYANSTITVTMGGEGTSTITVSVAGDSNHNAASKDIRVAVSGLDIVTWADGTPSQLKDMLDAHYAGTINIADYWSVGDERTITLSAMSANGNIPAQDSKTVTLVLYNAGGKTLSDGVTECAFVVGQKEVLNTSSVYSKTGGTSENGNVGWYGDLEPRKWCNETYKNAIPSDFRALLKEFKNTTYTGATDQLITVDDYVAYLSLAEVFPSSDSTVATYSAEGSQFDYFKTASNIPKKKNSSEQSNYEYWLRTPLRKNSNSLQLYVRDYTEPTWSWRNPTSTYCISPFFVI